MSPGSDGRYPAYVLKRDCPTKDGKNDIKNKIKEAAHVA